MILELHSKDKLQKESIVRSTPMPPRFALGPAEETMILEVIHWYRQRGLDPGYQGHFEEIYCSNFAEFLGGGYADAVSSGTASLFISLLALELPKESHVLVSPITDPGTLSAIILAGLKPKVLDSAPHSFNVNLESIQSRYDEHVSCLLIVHAAGQPVQDVAAIAAWAKQKNVKVLEDCSQAHGAVVDGQKVGSFGDIAAFSTMYRKASISGSSGGLIFTKNEMLYHNVLAYADRGKPTWEPNFDFRDPHHFLFPALNFHHDEIGCGIGIASLQRLPEVIKLRMDFIKALNEQMLEQGLLCCKPYPYTEGDSPFYYPIFVEQSKITCSKYEFACAIRDEGIGLNPHYQYLVCSWPWLQPYLADDFHCPQAQQVLASAFCLYLNENYGPQEVYDSIAAFQKVEKHFTKRSSF